MTAFLLDWVNLLARWVHLVTGIAWIGSSLYFIWLDNHLRAPADADEDIAGELWSVHGGGFYHARKFKVSPSQMPGTLHWFKWEAYWTWMSGIFLLGLVYFLGADVYLIDRGVAELSPLQAISLSLAFIIGGWVVYDLLCKTALVNNGSLFALLLLLLCSALSYALCNLFSGRAAYILFGVVLGTIMVANVFFVIIPGQKSMVAAAERGEAPDPQHGIRGKQRSLHNTYFTLPVLFVMTSNHFAMTFAHEYNWLVLILVAVIGALVRIYFVARHAGNASPWPVVVAVVLLAGLIVWMAPAKRAVSADDGIDFAQVRNVINARCVSCHASAPVHPAFPAAPLGIMFDTDEQILNDAARIYQQTVVTRIMPIGNLTAMTDDERQIIEQWFQSSQAQQ